MKILYTCILFLLFFFTSCNATQNKYLSVFDEVVNLLEQNYFEDLSASSEFDSLVSHHRAQLFNGSTEEEFIYVVNSMLFSFNVSHIGFGKISDIHKKASPYLWAEYSLGVDLRLIDGEAIVTKIDGSYPISKTELKIGDRIIKINNETIDEILANLELRPPNNIRNFTFLQTEEILRYLHGKSDSTIVLTYLNRNSDMKTVSSKLKKRTNGFNLFEGFPQVFLKLENRVFYDSIGYIKFNAFQPNNPANIINSINSYKSLPNLIIDLRGNNGGSIDAIRNIARELLKDSSCFYNLNGRENNSQFEVDNAGDYYKGKLIVIIDELSISAAEIFSDILQTTESAVIVGNQSPGNVLSGELFTLAGEYNLLLPTTDWERHDGHRLEGNGVIPNYSVNLKRSDLYDGIDTQLKFAIELIK